MKTEETKIETVKTVETAADTKKAERAARIAAKKAEAERKAKAKKTKKSPEGRLYIIGLIEKAKYTRKEVIALCMKKFPESAMSTWGTAISDSFNPKYYQKTGLGRYLKRDANGILSFSKNNRPVKMKAAVKKETSSKKTSSKKTTKPAEVSA